MFFDVPIASMKRKAPFYDKYANRAENGDLKRELIGVYFNFEMKFGDQRDMDLDLYDKLHDKLTEPVEFHTVTLPNEKSAYSFVAYVTEVDDDVDKILTDRVLYKDLTCKYIAQSPARTPS